ncbi:TonB C-terminal domain-containing protein [Methylotenera sp. L2L1]|uniref:TonB C-terminal domain-containing protein n=1 Tax=Methylotenera sp. L2L1 TaxID=1502770 RepID=UPI000567B3D2|nr:TonB C-terminal domain-containing protein [Methylotenera sp. L2L1]
MLRQRENPDSFKAGILSITVHTILLGALLISFNWKTTHPVSIAEVELWDSLPVVNVPKQPEPVVTPEPVVKETPKPEPKPEPVIEPKPQLKAEPKPEPEIAIKQEAPKKPVKKDPPKEPPKKIEKEDPLAKLQKQLMQDALEKPNKPPVNDVLKKLQQESLSDEKALGEQKSSAAKAGVVDEFKAKIQAKIRNNVNKSLCGDGNLELKFDIALLPTGELGASPKLTKSSGNPTCDEAVERAIRVSEPLPLPEDKTLFSQFRTLKLTFRPNDH